MFDINRRIVVTKNIITNKNKIIAIACDFFLLLERNKSFLVLLSFMSSLFMKKLILQNKIYIHNQLGIRYKLKIDIKLNIKIIFLSISFASAHHLI